MSASPRTSGLERWLAALVFGVPLYYLVTEHTRELFFVTWSKPWTLGVLLYSAFLCALLWSYTRVWPRWLEVLRRIALVLTGSTFAALVALEVGLRIADRPKYQELDNSGRHAADPDVGHVYVPNHRQTLQSREYRVEWASNAQGVRCDRDFGPKQPGVIRVLCVGDSFTACDQVEYRESWPAVLEACLNHDLQPARFEVVNAGFPGFATVNEARWIAKFAAAFAPDVVLLGMTPNDLLENQFPLQYTARNGQMVSSASTDADAQRYEHRKNWWCLAGVVERSLLKARFDKAPAVRRLLGRPPINHMEAYMVERNEKAQRLYALCEQYLEDARANAESLGAKFGLVVIPYSHQMHALGPNLDPTRFGRHWTEYAAAHGVMAVDALSAFLAHEEPASLHWKEDTHCTAAGYALVAAEVCRMLVEHREELGLPR